MRFLLFLVFFLYDFATSTAQTGAYNFRRVTTKDGMSDGVVTCIAQDKSGYTWFGTQAGLNRYDGYRVVNYTYNAKDSFSIPADFVRTMTCDKNGELWLGYTTGLYRFNYTQNRFEKMDALKGITVSEIRQGYGDNLCLLTSQGLAFYDTKLNSLSFCKADTGQQLLSAPMYEGWMHQSSVYIAAAKGVVIYDKDKKQVKLIPLKKDQQIPVDKVVIDSSGTIWASSNKNGGWLYKKTVADSSFTEINSFRYNKTGTYDELTDLYVDADNRLWIGTIWSGLVSVNTKDNSFYSITNDNRIANSIPENHVIRIFTDRSGFMWIGTEGSGAAYFQPHYNLFTVFFPEPLKYIRPHIWSRAITEDADGNLWMGTGAGLVKQAKDRQSSELFYRDEINGKLQLHSNSVRALLCDDENNIWIGTATGMNMYETAARKMHFFDYKDSLPQSFYWIVMQDSKKTLWFGSNSGLYYRLKGEKKIYSLYHHDVLRKYAGYSARSLLEDSRGNLWIGLNGKGLIFYDVKNKTTKYWSELGSSDSQLGKIISSIAEDKKGIVWFSSYYGMASYDYKTGTFTSYSDINAMESLQVSSLQADEEDRLWLASAKGLLMLDKQRKIFKRFNVGDGLPDIQFNDQVAYKLRNGQFVYPTYDGFVAFDPLLYKEKNISVNTVISSLSVTGSPIPPTIDFSAIKELQLSPSENFFSIELTAFNYSNPGETWYAYQLEGFDKNWVYTKNRTVNYTNVPGGNYTFRYKASSDPNNWEVEEKKIKIYIATVFYKTSWFLILGFVLLAATIMSIFRYRVAQKRKLMILESKAQSLEREKTQVQYDNLKQQLNPHFLFNSLTSLSSLINSDPKTAGKFLDSLSKTYRYILKNSDTEKVPLMNEIKFAESYISLQKTRFEQGLQVNINIEEDNMYRLIVPVTLQNLIENAIKHNVIDDESPLVIDIYTESDSIVIRNNLQKKNFVETSNKRGLESLKSLYHYLSSRPVEIKEDENYFTIKIPLL